MPTFLRHLERSLLLDAADLSWCRAVEDRFPQPPDLAKELVRQGKLSRFQAKNLLAGRSKGLVLGPYEVLDSLGRGGMAKVFLARDVASRSLFALKLLTPRHLKANPKLGDRLHRELEVALRLVHPSIARVYRLDVFNKVHCLTMEFVPGMDLGRWVLKNGPMSPVAAARFLGVIAIALEHTHQFGLIHADVKPGNLMVLPDNPDQPHHGPKGKLLDFGLAIDLRQPTLSETSEGRRAIAGTMAYIAPEQTRRHARVGPSADLYALGGTLFYALTGRAPFVGGTSRDKVYRQRYETPPRLRDVLPSAPAILDELIARLLSKKPENRPASAGDLAQELFTFARQASALHQPPPKKS